MDREKVIKGLEVCFDSSKECNGCTYIATPYCKTTLRNDVIALLKEQEELLRKLGKDKDKLCLEVSEWKHKFHDAPPKFVSQGVVDQIRWERDTALSQLEQIGKGLGSKMDDIVAMLKEQEKLVDVDALREKLGLAKDCAKCKQNTRACQYDSHFSLMDFCERFDMAIEELM